MTMTMNFAAWNLVSPVPGWVTLPFVVAAAIFVDGPIWRWICRRFEKTGPAPTPTPTTTPAPAPAPDAEIEARAARSHAAAASRAACRAFARAAGDPGSRVLQAEAEAAEHFAARARIHAAAAADLAAGLAPPPAVSPVRAVPAAERSLLVSRRRPHSETIRQPSFAPSSLSAAAAASRR